MAPSGAPSSSQPVRRSAGLFLVSAGALLLELSLTRVLSVQLWYHFGFFVVSTALLGFGAAGVLLTLLGRLRETQRLDAALAGLAAAAGGATVFAFCTTRLVPFDPFALVHDPRQLLFGLVFELLWALPFLCAGLLVALLLGRAGSAVGRLYAADLLGAALGCALMPPCMSLFGGPGSLLAAAALCGAGAALFAGRSRGALAAGLLSLACLLLAPSIERLLPVPIAAGKRAPPSPLWQGWNAISFLQVVDRPGPWPSRLVVIDGGTAVTSLPDLRGGVGPFLQQPIPDDSFDSSIGYPLVQSPRVLVIGSGAGSDLLDALRRGAARVVGVELNPGIVALGRERMRDFWGGLFEQPGVEVVVDEGRSYVRRSSERFDAIVADHTISNAAQAAGALGLAENYLLTREALGDFLGHLRPGGFLSITRPEAQVLRLVATVREAWEAAGRREVARSVLVWRRPLSTAGVQRFGVRQSFLAGMVAKDGPFRPEEVEEIGRRLRVGEAAPADALFGPAEILYSPLTPGAPGLEPSYAALLASSDLPAFYAAESAAIAPVTDDRPFFNLRTRPSRLRLSDVREVLGQPRGARLALEDRPVAEVALLGLLVQSLVIGALFLLLPLRRLSRGGLHLGRAVPLLVFFAALGLGFILVEMALLQGYTLYLGQPAWALSVVLTALLCASAAGSLLSSRLAAEPQRVLGVVVPLLVLLLAGTVLGTRLLFAATLGLPFALRALLAVLSLLPVGVCLGVPFATGLRTAAARDPRLVSWAFGVNGFFTVLGTVLWLLTGMTLGFSLTLGLAGLVYLLGLVAFLRGARN